MVAVAGTSVSLCVHLCIYLLAALAYSLAHLYVQHGMFVYFLFVVCTRADWLDVTDHWITGQGLLIKKGWCVTEAVVMGPTLNLCAVSWFVQK